jgi:hypothetical protein
MRVSARRRHRRQAAARSCYKAESGCQEAESDTLQRAECHHGRQALRLMRIYFTALSLSRSLSRARSQRRIYHSRRSHKPRLILTFLWSLITWINRSAARVELVYCMVWRDAQRRHASPPGLHKNDKILLRNLFIYVCVCTARSDMHIGAFYGALCAEFPLHGIYTCCGININHFCKRWWVGMNPIII